MENRKKHRLILFIVAVTMILFPFVFVNVSFQPLPQKSAQQIQKRFTTTENMMQSAMQRLASLNYNGPEENIIQQFEQIGNEYSENAMYFYRFDNKTLKNWSDNSLNITADLLKIPNNTIIEYDNNLIQVFKRKTGNNQLLGIFIIRKGYYINNKYLKPAFNPLLDIPENSTLELSTNSSHNLIKITDSHNSTSLYIDFKRTHSHTYEFILILIFYIGFILLLNFILKTKDLTIAIGLLLLVWLINFLSFAYEFPHFFYSISLFQPFTFSLNKFMFSLGDSLINVTLILYTILLLKRINFKRITHSKVFIFVNIFILVVSFELIFLFLKSLVFDSSFNLLFFSLTTLSLNHFVALITVFILIFAYYNFAYLLIKPFFQQHKPLFLIAVIFAGIGLFLYTYLRCSQCWVTGLILFVSFVGFTTGMYFLQNKKDSFSFIITQIGLISFLLSLLFFFYSEKKQEVTKNLVAVKLANERDYVAESLFPELKQKILSDTLIAHMISEPLISNDVINKYLTKTYFQGFWNNYDFQTTICQSTDSLNILESGEVVNCLSFFSNITDHFGKLLSDSAFYLLDNNNGRISYLGIIPFVSNGKIIHLFLEIDSKLISVKLGYPELLINGSLEKSVPLSEFFYAKYKNGRLIAQLGDISYPIIDNNYRRAIGNKQLLSISDKKYNHLIYAHDKHTIIVLSTIKNSFWNFIMEFSLLFIFGIISGLFVKVFELNNRGQFLRQLNFKRRIQLTFFGILFSFFIIVGTLTSFFVYEQLQEKFQEEMSERIESVKVELIDKIGTLSQLSIKDKNYLETLLTKFSNVFLTDIHLYGTDGRLLATSRPQIFEKNLIGEMMNVSALQALKIQKLSKYVHTEKIGKLSFVSAYIPFFNSNNKIIAYLNLPYFTRQSEITQQLSRIVVTIINIFLILILIAFIAVVVVTQQLTKPLEQIKSHIQQLQFGGKNLPILYHRQDEIGNLITEYNRMIEELEKNADLLAKSERESAWREMAKQVAHEIKNPLTPMKLSVQYLQKSWREHDDNLDKFIDHTANRLIEQIDALTLIANEFSHFAKMPKVKNETFKPLKHLKDLVQLFNNDDKYSITLNYTPESEDVTINMDKSQFNIVISNLIKNGIQAIPPSRKGEIKIGVESDNDFLKIEVSDNGVGIPEEYQKKIFTPNFTTKTSGMGIGLSIVNTIMQNVEGEIEFESESEKGTKFLLKFVTLKIQH